MPAARSRGTLLFGLACPATGRSLPEPNNRSAFASRRHNRVPRPYFETVFLVSIFSKHTIDVDVVTTRRPIARRSIISSDSLRIVVNAIVYSILITRSKQIDHIRLCFYTVCCNNKHRMKREEGIFLLIRKNIDCI